MNVLFALNFLAVIIGYKIICKFRLMFGLFLLALIGHFVYSGMSFTDATGFLVCYGLIPLWLIMLFLVTISNKVPPLHRYLRSL